MIFWCFFGRVLCVAREMSVLGVYRYVKHMKFFVELFGDVFSSFDTCVTILSFTIPSARSKHCLRATIACASAWVWAACRPDGLFF